MNQENNSNEITVRLLKSKDEIVKILIEKGFDDVERFSLDDDFYIPNDIDISKMTFRDILKKAILVRTVTKIEEKTFITFKEKHFDENGNIVFQKSTYCHVYDKNEASDLLRAIGYKFLMNIQENDIVYKNDDIEFALKDVDGGDLLAEIEVGRNTKVDTIDKLIEYVDNLNLPIDKGEFFVKKAEIELEKVLKNKRM